MSEEVNCDNGCELRITGEYSARFIGGAKDGETGNMPLLNDSGPSPYIGVNGEYYDLIGKAEGSEFYDYLVRELPKD